MILNTDADFSLTGLSFKKPLMPERHMKDRNELAAVSQLTMDQKHMRKDYMAGNGSGNLMTTEHIK